MLKWWILASIACIVVTPTVMGLYDDVAESVSNEVTISRISQRTAWKYPLYQWCLCFLLAELCGHLFTTKLDARPMADWLSVSLLVVLPYLVTVLCLISGIIQCHGNELPTSGPSCFVSVVFSLLLGAASGAFLLHQTGS